MFADDTTIPLPALYVEAADPTGIYTDGRSFAKRVWLDTSTGTIGTLKKRNAANTGWDTLINLDSAVFLSPAVETLTDGATITWATAGKRINNAQVTLGGNRTLDITGEVDGATGTLIVIQDGTGSRTLTLPGSSKVINAGAGAVALSTGVGDIDILTWVFLGSTFYWTIGSDYT